MRHSICLGVLAIAVTVVAAPSAAGPFDKIKDATKGGGSASQSGVPSEPERGSEEDLRQEAAKFDYGEGYMIVVEPAPGRVTVGPIKINWCDKVKPVTGSYAHNVAGQIRRTFESSQQHWFTPTSIEGIFTSLCAYPDHPGFQKQAGYVVQYWLNTTGQSKEEALQSMLWRVDADKWKAALDKGCDQFQVPQEATHEQEVIARARQRFFCNRQQAFWVFRGEVHNDYEWYVDRREAPPTEIDRVTFALTCIPPGGRDWTQDDWLRIGMCGNDVKALDRTKLEQDTASMNPELKAVALESYHVAKTVYKDLEATAKEKVATDPDYKSLIYDAPQAGWKNWVAQYSAHKQGMEATFAFEQALWAPRKSAVEGCWGKVEKGPVDFVKAGKYKTKEEFIDGATGPIGYALFNALGACYAVTAPPSVGALLLEVNYKTRVWRGPRTAARWAMVDRLAEIKADRTRFPVNFGYFQTGMDNLLVERARSAEMWKVPSTGTDFNQMEDGVVKTMKKSQEQKDDLVLIFKTESWMEPTYNCVETNKVQSIDASGRVTYRRKCRSTGKSKRTFTPNPTKMYKWAAHGVKPNSFVIMKVPAGSDYGNRMRRGYPIEVYKTKQRKVLLNMYGFAL